MTGGLLAIIGSGETAPTMVKPHRGIFERVGDASAVLLDTPYGFQVNAQDISTRAVSYFAASVGRRVEVVSWRVAPPPGFDRERALAAIDTAGWVFAGPGSPTYALRQWAGTPIPGLLAQKLARGDAVVFASAAALTLGSHTVPVYEIYKAGIDPHWVPGLDLIAQVTGLPAVVIPHYNNAEGGHHDTRFCYLGEARLAALERNLPPESFIIGVDEHTAVLLDLAAGTASVVGHGMLTIRRQGVSVVYPSGSVLPIATLGSVSAGTSIASTVESTPPAPAPAQPATSLRAAADQWQAEFDEALRRRDVDGCVAAILGLEEALLDWFADTLTSNEGEHARNMLRIMVVRLGALAADGIRDPRELVRPFIEALLDVRERARRVKDFAAADQIRGMLSAAGIEVRDSPNGVQWLLRERSGGPVPGPPEGKGTAIMQPP